MKKIFIGIMAMIATLTAFIACEDEIDEVAQWNKLADYSVRIAKLENACEILNSNVVSLNILAEAQKDNIGITDVKEVAEGCVIFFSDGRYVVLRNGADGKDGVDGKDGQDGLNGTNGVDGKDGKDGYVPAIAIKKDVDGIYYWTCDGAFMIDENGSKVPAQGKDGVNGTNGANGLVAQFMVSENGELQYRYNDTDAWTSLGNVKGADGANGADGVNGTNGTNGTNGVDGKSPTFKIEAGNLMVSYDGENWSDLGTVKGADGANGVDGANGTNGTNGADGVNGTNGTNGKDGITPEFKIDGGLWYVSYDNKTTWIELGQATGDKGEKGDTGAKGDKGDAGVNGTNGTNGTDGINGTNGTNGTNGKDGITPKLKIVDGYWYISYDGGATWETDPIGQATGDKGDKGDKGDAGVDGKTPTFKIEGGVLFVSYDATTWTSLGKISGENGTDGKTPTMKIESGDWYVSYDKGETWTNLGQATGDKGDNGITPTFKVESGNLYVNYNEGTSWTNLGNVKGADGTAGKDGVSPKLKITSGYWYISYDNEKTWTKLDKATGANGTNGVTPTFKVESGNLYVSYNSGTSWTNLGSVKGANGTNGKDGVSPKLKITDGYWYISYDNGTTWTKLDKATGATPTFKIENGELKVSTDGKTWNSLGNVKGETTVPDFQIVDGVLKVSTDGGKTWSSLGSVTGSVPQMKYEDGKWYVSYDGGKTWDNVKGTGLNLSMKSVSIYTDGTFNLTATTEDGTVISPSNITWSTSTPSTLSHVVSGTATKFTSITTVPATVTLTAKYNGTETTCIVEINKKPSINLSQTSVTILTNGSFELTAKENDGTLINPSDITWKTSVVSALTSVVSGKATKFTSNVTSASTVTLTATYNGVSATCVVTINAVDKNSLSLSVTSVSIYTDQSVYISAKVDGKIVTPSNILWRISNPSALSQSTSGDNTVFKSTATESTNVTLTAIYDDKVATCEVEIKKIAATPVVSKIGDHEYVDLGLPSGLKWATMNVGATKPESYGSLFAWGEVATKVNYDGSSSLTYNKSLSTLQTAGIVDANGVLTPEYDAATQNWSENWRMPTKAEFEELLNKCTWTWTTLGGVKGYRVASKKAGNNNWIFLPAAGFRNGTTDGAVGGQGHYWSSTYNSNNDAFSLYLQSSNVDMAYSGRYVGRSVRPVTE